MSPVVCKLLVTPAISLDRYWIHHDAVVTHTIGSKNCSSRGTVKTGALKYSKDFGLNQQDRKVPDTEIEPVQQWRRRTRSVLVEAMAASAPQDSNQEDTDRKSEEYNKAMQRKMKNPYEYHHELGMYYTHIYDNLIVGSQPQSKYDIERLFEDEGVRAILNLQQDKDIEYWGIDINSILHKCQELGIWHMRIPARDFDPQSLRQELPRAVAALEWAISQGKMVYVHCTAGLGRAPAVAIAYLYWFHGMDMETAYNFLTAKRPCGPKKEAIRGATYDLAKTDPNKQEMFESLPDHAFTNIATWERQLIQERVCSLRGQ